MATINGAAFSWVSIELTLGGRLITGVQGISYSDKLARGEIRGAGGSYVIGYTRGELSSAASLTLLRQEWDELIGELGRGFGEEPISGTVSYAEDESGKPGSGEVVSDTLAGFLIDEAAVEAQQGSEAAVMVVPMRSLTPIRWGRQQLTLLNEEATEVDWFAGGVGPLYASSPIDTVTLGGLRLPGVCRVHGTAQIEIDKKKGKGQSGATITINSYLPGPLEIECVIWTAAQWAEWQALMPKLWHKPVAKGDYKAFAIVHPEVNLCGIRDVVVAGFAPGEGPVPRSRTIQIKLHEYQAPKAKPSKTVKTVKVDQIDAHKFPKPANYTPARPAADATVTGPMSRADEPVSGA